MYMHQKKMNENAFSPKMEIDMELQVIRDARVSLGGKPSRPIQIDLDILAAAYPHEGEGQFLRTENVSLDANTQSNASTPSKLANVCVSAASSPRNMAGRRTPNRRFFKTENEREYARSLMKELVQLYILQGVHGKDAFRRALVEVKRRIHLRRGEDGSSPPIVTSPIITSPYPKLSPPEEIRVTPSRVQSIVAAIQTTPRHGHLSSLKPVTATMPVIRAVHSLSASIASLDLESLPHITHVEKGATEVDAACKKLSVTPVEQGIAMTTTPVPLCESKRSTSITVRKVDINLRINSPRKSTPTKSSPVQGAMIVIPKKSSPEQEASPRHSIEKSQEAEILSDDLVQTTHEKGASNAVRHEETVSKIAVEDKIVKTSPKKGTPRNEKTSPNKGTPASASPTKVTPRREITSPKKGLFESEECTPRRTSNEGERSSARIRKQAELDETKVTLLAEHASPSRRAIVEHASPSRKKVARKEVTPPDSPPTVSRPPRRAAAIAAIEALEEPAHTRSAAKKKAAESDSEEDSSAKRTRKRTKKIAPLDTIPEDETVVVPIRPSRKAKLAAVAVIKK